MILILTTPNDEHAAHVMQRLRERRCEFFVFDPATFPAHVSISVAYTADGYAGATLVTAGGDHIDLDSVRMVWYRRPGTPQAPAQVTDPRARIFADSECKAFLQDLWGVLDCTWVPAAPSVVLQASLKASQLRIAADLGFEIPPTVITTDSEQIVSFYNKHNGNIVSKLVGTSLHRTLGSTFVRYTEPVTKRDVVHVAAAKHCPSIFQTYISKDIELRITVIENDVFAAEIHSQETNHTRFDWRRYDDNTPYRRHVLPSAVKERCVRLLRRLGLRYGAIDMIRTPDNRYVFLEINPNGQYLWIEDHTGLPITDALCNLLTGSASDASHNQPQLAGSR
jgi:hypothetical protein